jgi:hypothetical protein
MVQIRWLPRSASLLFRTPVSDVTQLRQFKYIAENLSPLAHGSNVVDATISDARAPGGFRCLKFDNSMDASFYPVLVPNQCVEPFLSITPPIARLIKRARQCPTELWGPPAETRRFNAYALESDSRQARRWP